MSNEPIKTNLIKFYEKDRNIIIATEYIIRRNKSINTFTDALKFMCNGYLDDRAKEQIMKICLTMKGDEIIETVIIKED